MKPLRFISVIAIAAGLAACDSYKEPATNEEWKAFCEAPDSVTRIKAIANEGQRQKAGSICLNAPWQKAVQSKPRTW